LYRVCRRRPNILEMKLSADTQKAISVILIYLALLFFLIGMAARLKSEFHARLEISTAGFVVSAVLAAAGVIILLFSLTGKRS
jgi:amino acid transporter